MNERRIATQDLPEAVATKSAVVALEKPRTLQDEIFAGIEQRLRENRGRQNELIEMIRKNDERRREMDQLDQEARSKFDELRASETKLEHILNMKGQI